MLKAIALAGIFVFTSSFVPSLHASSKSTDASTQVSSPKAPAPQGFCPNWPC
jgi:hypothetical protein